MTKAMFIDLLQYIVLIDTPFILTRIGFISILLRCPILLHNLNVRDDYVRNNLISGRC